MRADDDIDDDVMEGIDLGDLNNGADDADDADDDDSSDNTGLDSAGGDNNMIGWFILFSVLTRVFIFEPILGVSSV